MGGSMRLLKYKDYRDFIRAHVKSLPASGRGELAKISKSLSVSPTLLSQILAGTRSLTPDQAYDLGVYLHFESAEFDYISLQVQLERCTSISFRKHLELRLEALRESALNTRKEVRYEKELAPEDRATFYSSWLYSAVHLFTTTNSRGVTFGEVCARFRLSPAVATRVLDFLVSRRICALEDARYKVKVGSTYVDKSRQETLKHHLNWRLKATEKAEFLTEREMMFTAQASIAREDFLKVRELLSQTIQKVSQMVEASPAQEVVNLNVDWFFID